MWAESLLSDKLWLQIKDLMDVCESLQNVRAELWPLARWPWALDAQASWIVLEIGTLVLLLSLLQFRHGDFQCLQRHITLKSWLSTGPNSTLRSSSIVLRIWELLFCGQDPCSYSKGVLKSLNLLDLTVNKLVHCAHDTHDARKFRV